MNTIYNYWFSNKNIWFDATEKDDKYIQKTYQKYLLLGNYYEKLNLKQKISYILLFDQFPRHIYRKQRNIPDIEKKLYKLSLIACKISDLIDINQLNIYEKIFVYLPYRHTDNSIKIEESIHTFKNLLSNSNDKDKSLIKRFIRATYNKLININHTLIVLPYYKNSPIKNINSILDFGNYTMLNSLNYKNSLIINHPLYIKCIDILNKYNYKHLVISISGGVDSIICLYILNQIIKYEKKYNKIFLEAIHINYNNRNETIIEEQFVNYFCIKQNINLYIRRITELNRDDCINYNLRELYEDLTKQIRFKSYHNIIDNDKLTAIILGHNKDDCFENFINNVKNYKNYNNILGMQEYTYNNNINLIRPFLDIYKKDIVNFAINNNIPYLKDSTPSWSQRGKIRDKIVPVFNNYDNNLIDNIFKYINYNQKIYSQIDNIIIEKFLKQNVQYFINQKKIIKISFCENYNNILWENIFNKIFKHLKEKLQHTKYNVSNKTINNLITIIKRYYDSTKKKRRYIIINKNLVGFLYTNNNIDYLEIIEK